jgi:hypothetical protein
MNVRLFVAAILLISPLPLIAAPATAAVLSDTTSPRLWTSRDIAEVTGKPFSATRITKLEAASADGSSPAREISAKIVRDSSGRVRTETQVIHQPDGHVDPGNVAVQVYDPVARTILSWTTQSRTATLIHLSQQPVVPASSSTNMESLGRQAINSMDAEGERATQVIPAGSGYKEAATVVTETWTSSDLKIPVRQTISDPRHGTTTAELSDISQDEPDAALFQAPAGYTVRDLTPPAASTAAAK